jgi:thiamine biosynthesis lipoprotein
VIERVQYHMGTYARVLINDGNNADADAAFLRIKELDGLLSDYDPESEVSEISRMAGKNPVKVSPDVIDVLKEAVYVARETDGAFDPTIGALTIGAYRFGRDRAGPPADDEIRKAKSLVNYRDLRIDGDKVYLERGGMRLDLGGIGKGYAVEEAVRVLKQRGIKRGMVSLSGDIKVFGDDIEIGVRDPNGEGMIASFHTGTGELAISTSGGYERVIDPGGKAYHHLLVPATGRPGRDFLSVTVILDGDSALADAYATALFVMGKENALTFLKKHPEIGVFIVLPHGEIHYNDRMKSLVRGLEARDG